MQPEFYSKGKRLVKVEAIYDLSEPVTRVTTYKSATTSGEDPEYKNESTFAGGWVEVIDLLRSLGYERTAIWTVPSSVGGTKQKEAND